MQSQTVWEQMFTIKLIFIKSLDEMNEKSFLQTSITSECTHFKIEMYAFYNFFRKQWGLECLKHVVNCLNCANFTIYLATWNFTVPCNKVHQSIKLCNTLNNWPGH